MMWGSLKNRVSWHVCGQLGHSMIILFLQFDWGRGKQIRTAGMAFPRLGFPHPRGCPRSTNPSGTVHCSSQCVIMMQMMPLCLRSPCWFPVAFADRAWLVWRWNRCQVHQQGFIWWRMLKTTTNLVNMDQIQVGTVHWQFINNSFLCCCEWSRNGAQAFAVCSVQLRKADALSVKDALGEKPGRKTWKLRSNWALLSPRGADPK